MSTIYDITVEDFRGNNITLSDYQNQVLLIVNTASECGFTPQYEELEQLQKKYNEQGFTVLAFPCNQFKKQEPGNNSDIKAFCDLHFNISFPLFSKIEVNGENTHPLYQYLKQAATGILGSKSIKWNFTKFLVNKQGQAVKRYAPTTKPLALSNDIENLL